MKLAKLSLAAIMTVGAISAANATQLEEAIKGVDFAGYVQYRFEDAKQMEQKNKYEIRGGFTTPVQENLSVLVRGTAGPSFDSNSKASLSAVTLDRAQITYSGFAHTKIVAGRQYAGTPLDDTAAQGVKVLYSPMSSFTLAAAYYTEDSAYGNAIGAIGGIYSSDMFSARGWYIAKQDADSNTKDGVDYMFAEAGMTFAPVSVLAQYATAKSNAAGAKTEDSLRIKVSGKVASASLQAGYVTNDKNGGNVSLDGSAEGDNDLVAQNWKMNTYGADTDYFFVGASVPAGPVGLSAKYLSASLPSGAAAGTDESEMVGQISYNVSKKLATYARYSVVGKKSQSDSNYFRFQAKYSF